MPSCSLGFIIGSTGPAVGPTGHVLTVDIEPAMFEYIQDWTSEEGIDNVETVEVDRENTRVEVSSVDRILTVNTWRPIPDRPAYSDHLAERLRVGGSVCVVNYEADAPMGVPEEYRFESRAIVGELE